MPPNSRRSLLTKARVPQRTYDSVAYFAKRAPRYQAALEGCPAARSLDFIPYLTAISQLDVGIDQAARVFEAFGGTGFLARGLSRFDFDFAVVDGCVEMLQGVSSLPRVEPIVTMDDFKATVSVFGSKSFDLVLCHGGLHHVVGPGDPPDPDASRARQSAVVTRLARIVRPGGALVVADIPEGVPSQLGSQRVGVNLSEDVLRKCFSSGSLSFLARVLALKEGQPWSVEEIERLVETKLWQPVQFPVPRHYFDEFVAKQSEMGHVAVFPDFEQLHQVITSEGLELMWRLNYRGPWIFSSRGEAGWFFREKFSLFDPSPLGVDPESEEAVFNSIRRFLGGQESKDWVSVNWGVTYAAYRRQ